MSTHTRVLVTGLGATTPLGADVPATWQAMLDGRCGVRALGEGWADSPVRIGAPLAQEPAEALHRSELGRLDRGTQAALIAAREAWTDAELGPDGVDPDRLAVCVSASIAGVTSLLAQYDRYLANGTRRVSPFTIPMLMPNAPGARIGLEFNARASIHATASACATGAAAIAAGMDLIYSGHADVVIAGGADALLHPMIIAAFASMRAMSTRNEEPQRACRPFDKTRDGFVLGEGAGIVVLERADHAIARGATAHAELVGAGISADAHDMVQPPPDGGGGARAIRMALRDGDLKAADVVHVNAHATGTPLGDEAEARAITAAVGTHPAVTAVKSMTGHLAGASSAVEAITTVLSVRDGVIPATLNLDNPDDRLQLDVVTGAPREMPVPLAINNSFGFGGHNVALAFTPV